MVQVKERTFQEVKAKYESLATDLIKMEYLESTLRGPDSSIDIKNFAYSCLATLYERRLMFDKAGKAMAMKAGYDTTFREKIETYLKAAEYYAKAQQLMIAEDMFVRASREGNAEQQARVALTRKNIYLSIAAELEKKGRMTNAAKFYEQLLSMKLDELEKSLIKKKLLEYYTKMGRFNDAKLVEKR